MINPLILKDDILILLKSLIGMYTFPGGDTCRAIAILPDPDSGWLYPEQGTKVTGLEVIIKQPYPEASPNIGGDRTNSYTWEIHLKQWDTTQTTREALEILTSELPQYRIERVSIMPASDKLLTVEQCKIFITEWALITGEF
jgi:hypothetical protein